MMFFYLHILLDDVRTRVIEQSIQLYDTNSKAFANLYKTIVVTQNNTKKTIKADRKLMQLRLCKVTAGWEVDMISV